jgi:metallo-beta-lactamase class B
VFPVDVADVDMVIEDGDTLQLGDQTITLYITPGHTEGVLSMEFRVRDGDDEYRAVIFGGGGANAGDYWRNQTILGNIRRFQVLAAQSPAMRVRFAGHTNGPGGAGGVPFFERRDLLSARGPEDPHPFVDDSSAFVDYLNQAEQTAEQAVLH